MRAKGASAAIAAMALVASPAPAHALVLVREAAVPGIGAGAVALADVDADGLPDAVVLDAGASPRAVVLRGLGDAGLGAPRATPLGAGALGLAAVPVSDSSAPDLVVAAGAAGLRVLPNDGAGAFGAARAVSVPGGASAVAGGGLHQQDAPPLDVVVGTTAAGAGAVAAYDACDGAGCAGPLADPDVAGLGAGTDAPSAVVVAALAGPDAIDSAVADPATDTVRVAPFDPELFRYLGDRVTVATGDRPVALAAGDVDGDGLVDLVTADAGAGAASVLVQVGVSSLALARHVAGSGCTGASDVALGDLDRDGALDLVLACPGVGPARVLLNRGDGTFAAGPALAGADGAIVHVAVGDLDGDGAPEVVATTAGRSLLVFRAPARPTVAPASLDLGAVEAGTAGAPAEVVLGDDGPGDVVLAAARVTGRDAASFTVDGSACDGPLAPGATCAVQVRLAPRAAGAVTATLELVPLRGPTLRVALAGKGFPAGPPRITALAVRRLGNRRGVEASFAVARPVTAAVRLERRGGRRFRSVTTVRRALRAGRARIVVPRPLAAGVAYRMVITVVDARGRRAQVLRAVPRPASRRP